MNAHCPAVGARAAELQAQTAERIKGIHLLETNLSFCSLSTKGLQNKLLGQGRYSRNYWLAQKDLLHDLEVGPGPILRLLIILLLRQNALQSQQKAHLCKDDVSGPTAIEFHPEPSLLTNRFLPAGAQFYISCATVQQNIPQWNMTISYKISSWISKLFK